MRRFLSILAVCLLALTAVHSQSLNIATWVVELPDSNTTNRAAEHEPFLQRAAAVLKPLNPDIIVLHGFPGRTATKQLSDLLRPRVYHNPIYSSFRKDPPSTEQLDPAITVLTKRVASHTKTIDWRSTGRLDIPGGFSFAVFPLGTNLFVFYTVQFPKVVAGMPRDRVADIPRRRELCARYIVSHQSWLFEAATNSGKFAYLATDLEMDPASATNDPALAILTANGFKPCSGNRTMVASAALSSTGWPPDGSLTSAFLKGTEFPSDPQSVEQKGFFAPVALIELDLKSPAKPPAVVASASPVGRPAATTNAAAVPPTPPPVLATARDTAHDSLVSWTDNRTLVLGAGTLALVIAGFLWIGLRRQPLASPPIVPAGSIGAGTVRTTVARTATRVTETRRFGGPFQVLEHPAMNIDPDEDLDAGSDADDPTRARARARAARGRPSPQVDPQPKGSNWTFIQLLRERMVRWLAAERSQLLSSHHAGAEQVLELEERLTRIQNQFETRLRAREQRVTELEAELIAKEKMMADLESALASKAPRKPPGPPSSPSSPPTSPLSS